MIDHEGFMKVTSESLSSLASKSELDEKAISEISSRLIPIVENIYSLLKLMNLNLTEIFTITKLLSERYYQESYSEMASSSEKNKILINSQARYTAEQLAEKTKAYKIDWKIDFGDKE